MANNVARLGVVLGLNTAEFIAGIENASKKLDRFAKSIDQYAKYGATALAAMSVAALKFADDIADVADANDVAIDTVVKLRMALDASGGSADKAGVMLSAFTKFIDTAADGSFEAQKAFKSVGVSLKDIGSMTQEQLLKKVLSGLEQMEDTVTRDARAMDFFTKAAKGVAFDKFAQEMSNTTALTREQIEAVKAGAETWDNLQKIISKVQLLFVNALGPSLKAINSTITDETFPKIQMLGTAFNFLASNIYSAYKAMQSVAILLEKIAGYSVIMQTYGESNEGSAQLKKLDEETNKRLEEIQNQQTEFDRILEGGRKGFPTGVYPKWGKPKDGDEELRPTTVGVDAKAEKAKAEADAIAKQTKQLEAKLELQKDLLHIEKLENHLRLRNIDGDKIAIDLTNVELQQEMQLANIENSRAQALSNEKLTAQQISLINEDFNLQEEKANEKAVTDKAYILNINDKLLGLYAEQEQARENILNVDKDIGNHQLAAMRMDKLQADTQANALQLRKEILRINGQEVEDLAKANMSDVDRSNIIRKSQDDRTKAIQAFKQTNAIVTSQYQDQLEAVQLLDNAQKEGYDFDVRRQVLEQNRYQMRQDEIKLVEEQIASEQKIADLRRQQMQSTITMGKGALADAENKRFENAINQEKQLSEARKQSIKDEYDRQQSFSAGWNNAFNSYMQNATNAATLGSQAFNAFVGNMNSALDKFVDTGKVSFSDLANSIIKDLIKIQLKAAASAMFSDMGGGGLGGGNIFGMFNGAGTGGTAYGGGIAGAGGSSTFRASGGTVSGNSSYIVGERGPELFVPSASGTVIPTNNLASTMGGGGQTVNYNGPYIANMSAIDTQTGVQFLAKNKQTIWASYQSANRSVPVSR